MTCLHAILAACVLLGVCQARSRLEQVDDDELLRIFHEDINSHANDLDGDITTNELEQLSRILKQLMSSRKTEGIDYGSEAAAEEWLTTFNAALAERTNVDANAQWQYMTNLTQANAERATSLTIKNEEWFKGQVVHVKAFMENAEQFEDDSIKRMLHKILYGRLVPVSDDIGLKRRLSEIEMQMENIYASAKVKDPQDGGRDLALDPDLQTILQTSRDYDRLLWVWTAWRDAVGPKVKRLFTRLVTNMNKAARENDIPDIGVAWKIADFDDPDIEDSVVDLWSEVEPLYRSLHAYVRRRLIQVYPELAGGEREPIPAHLLGDMWAQQWFNIYQLVTPYPDAPSAYDVGPALVEAGYDARRMFQLADGFFQSLSMAPMTDTFWNRSMIERPGDGREVACHGSAEDFFKKGDFRIKMCTSINADSFETVHHEMGHVQYFMQYADQPTVFRDGANAAFHEAVGDTIALAASTPKHLATVGLLHAPTTTPTEEEVKQSNINFLMLQALKKVVFLPFGYLIDKWRWDVFSGQVGPDNYNAHWWKLRLELQGLKPPVKRTDEDFDPGAKYHIPGNVPYVRYFLSHIGEFQFYKAMCEAAGHVGPIHTCDFFGSQPAGQKLMDMLSLGASKPWPDAMEVMTGQREFRAAPLLEYFLPLAEWLEEQNQGEFVGWDRE